MLKYMKFQKSFIFYVNLENIIFVEIYIFFCCIKHKINKMIKISLKFSKY